MKTIKEDIHHCGILIIEDDYIGRLMLKKIFEKNGFTRIEEAKNGREGLERIQSFRPDIVVLDVLMPEMDGIEFCRRIRADPDPQIANVPVLFQTSLEGTADKASLFNAGATDYITKPIDQYEIMARAMVHLEREIMMRHLREFNIRISQELDTARISQRILIPDAKAIKATEKNYGLQINGHYQTCSELGGDFWGFKSLSSNELALYIIDFTGHGVNAALNVFRLHALMHNTMNPTQSPGAYLSHLNSILAPLMPAGQSAAMFYGVINQTQNTLAYASTAAPAPIVFSNKGIEYQILNANGALLGASGESHYETTTIPFIHGDCLLLYSDALIETKDAKSNMLSAQEATDIFQAQLRLKPDDSAEAFNVLREHFRTHYAPRLADDLTITTYQRR